MMPFNPNMKPAWACRTFDNNHRRRRWRRKSDFNLLYFNSNRLAGDNNAAGQNSDSKKANDI
jgi:hypothetical protein